MVGLTLKSQPFSCPPLSCRRCHVTVAMSRSIAAIGTPLGWRYGFSDLPCPSHVGRSRGVSFVMEGRRARGVWGAMRMTPGLRWMALVSVLVGTASLHASPAFASAPGGCRSHTTLAPWGRYPMRRWTPIRSIRHPATIDDDGGNREGLAIGAPFRARLVQAYGVDDGDARQIVEMVTADGCYRAFGRIPFGCRSRLRQSRTGAPPLRGRPQSICDRA